MGLGISKHPVGILLVGLDNSGKTTIIDWLANKSTRSTGDDIDNEDVIVPTIGFSARRFKFRTTPIIVLDMSGQGRYRNLWRYYFRQCDVIVYVVDAADAARLPVAFAELWQLLNDCTLILRRPRLPVLILANKSDQPRAADNYHRFANDVCARCRETCRPCQVIASCALTGDGLITGFDWLLRQAAVAGPRWCHDEKPTWYQHP